MGDIMNFLECYKPKNLWKLVNGELNPSLDEYSMIYINAVKDFACICKSMSCNDIETFTDVYTGISKSVLTLYKIYGYNELSTRELILYAITFGAKNLDMNTYKTIVTNVIKLGDKRIVSSYLGCLLDIAEHLGIERTANIINSNNSFEFHSKILTTKE